MNDDGAHLNSLQINIWPHVYIYCAYLSDIYSHLNILIYIYLNIYTYCTHSRVLERLEFLDCYMQKYRRIPQADVEECSELQSEYNTLMLNISSSDASDADYSSHSFTSSLSTMVSSNGGSTGAGGDSSAGGAGGAGVNLNTDNNNNDNNVFHLPPDLPLERTAMEWGRIAQRIVNRKCYPKANNIRYI
jgi:hypothetical protein